MAPSTLRRGLVSEMRKTVLAMMSPQWDLALEGRTKQEVLKRVFPFSGSRPKGTAEQAYGR